MSGYVDEVTDLRIGSLFAGIGGLELGLELAGVGKTVWQVEQNAWCRNVLEAHWPYATRHNDVREVGAHNLEPVDIICGGFPCQDISLAGRGAGLAGARSGLWFEYARIIGELRPRVVVVENVAALAARGLDAILGDLAARGYDAVWFPLRASDVGAPHKRERLFVVAYTHEQGLEGRRLQKCEGESERTAGQSSARWPATGRAESCVGREVDGISAMLDGRWPARKGQVQHDWEVPRAAIKIPERRQRIQALGNAVVPQVAHVVGLVVRGVLSRTTQAEART